MDTSFSLDALEGAIQKYGKPEIMRTDQGSQFTSQASSNILWKTVFISAWMARMPGETIMQNDF